MDVQPVLIGKLAALSGVTVASVRVYERKGLIGPLYRAPNGYRYYDAGLQLPIRVFGAAMSLGISLAEIGEIFGASRPLLHEPTPEQARDATAIAAEIYRRHTAAIDAEIERLGTLRAHLAQRIEYCTSELAGAGPVRIGVPTTSQRRLSRPGRVEYVRPA
jgi:DNA-binding transcriptional MerR regulator